MTAPTGYISIEEHEALVALVREQAFGAGMVHWDDLTRDSKPEETVKSLASKLNAVLGTIQKEVPPVVFEALDLVLKLF